MATPAIDVARQDDGGQGGFAPARFGPGEIAPKEGPAQGQENAQPELGPNNENLEKLKPRIVGALREMIIQYRTEGIVSRRHEIRDAYVCPNCGAETPATGFMAGGICPECGMPLGDENLKAADYVPVPKITGTRRVPNGQEVIDIIGGLEFHRPVWANELHEYPYLQWQKEVHLAKLKASYPHVADKIQMGGPIQADDVYARAARVSVSQGLPTIHPGDALYSLVTFSRTWIRPWAFYHIEDKSVRDELLQLFPDGCYVAFAGETYCESRNENLEDHWRVMHALPGDGQNRPSVGDSLVQIQEQYNVLSNIEAETYEFGIPPIYVEQKTLDFDALQSQVAEPASHYPIFLRPGERAGDKFFQPTPPQVPPDAIKRRQELMGPIAQMLTGLFPAIFGGEMENVKTATGYAIARDQAMGRLGLVWRRLKGFYADLMMLSVDCFRKNRPEDVQIPILGDGGEFESKWIRLADLKGNIQAHPEADEQFPRLKSQQRAVLQQLMASPDPILQQIASEPTNMAFIKGVLGLSDIVIPGEDARTKQLREIEQLLSAIGGPIEQPPVADPVTGQIIQAPPMASVAVDELLDNHAAEFEECKRWANSDAGQAAKIQNPAGFANVRAHAQAHLTAMQGTATR